MKYGDFKKECQRTEQDRSIFEFWMEGKLPLGLAMDILLAIKIREDYEELYR